MERKSLVEIFTSGNFSFSLAFKDFPVETSLFSVGKIPGTKVVLPLVFKGPAVGDFWFPAPQKSPARERQRLFVASK